MITFMLYKTFFFSGPSFRRSLLFYYLAFCVFTVTKKCLVVSTQIWV